MEIQVCFGAFYCIVSYPGAMVLVLLHWHFVLNVLIPVLVHCSFAYQTAVSFYCTGTCSIALILYLSTDPSFYKTAVSFYCTGTCSIALILYLSMDPSFYKTAVSFYCTGTCSIALILYLSTDPSFYKTAVSFYCTDTCSITLDNSSIDSLWQVERDRMKSMGMTVRRRQICTHPRPPTHHPSGRQLSPE